MTAQSTVTLSCNGCGNAKTVQTTQYAAARVQATSYGWTYFIGDDSDFCNVCVHAAHRAASDNAVQRDDSADSWPVTADHPQRPEPSHPTDRYPKDA